MPKKRGSKSKAALSRNRPNKARPPKEEQDMDEDSSMTSAEGGITATTTESEDTSISSRSSPGPSTSGAKSIRHHNPKPDEATVPVCGFKVGVEAIIEEEDETQSDDSATGAVPVPRGKAKGKVSASKGKYVVSGKSDRTGRQSEIEPFAEPKLVSFVHQNESSSSKESVKSGVSGAAHSANSTADETGVSRIRESSDIQYLRILNDIKGFPNLTEELEQTGQITKYITKAPELQQYELEKRTQLLKFKRESTLALKHFDNYVDHTLKMANPKELMKMSVEDLLEIIEHARGIKIESFEDLLLNMKNLQGSEIANLKSRTSEINVPRIVVEAGDEDLFENSFTEDVHTPSKSNGTQPVLKKVGSSKVGSSKVDSAKGAKFVFPSSKEMVKNPEAKFATPLPFRFEGANALASTANSNKVPRVLKPGEQVRSMNGSPIFLPRLPRVPAGIPERIHVTDGDGKKVVDVVLYKGADDKLKEYNYLVSAVKSLVAKSTSKSNRILPPRVPTRGAAGPSSATKKPTPWQY